MHIVNVVTSSGKEYKINDNKVDKIVTNEDKTIVSIYYEDSVLKAIFNPSEITYEY